MTAHPINPPTLLAFGHSGDKEKLSCRRETAWCFVSLNILPVTQGHSRSFKMTLLRRAFKSLLVFQWH